MLHPKAEHIQDEIMQRLGFLPPFFEPAYNAPVVLRNLWQQTLDAYLDNPLPDLFKEKLAVVLSRYCTVPYCMLCHSSTLRPLGMSATAILELLEMPALGFIELSEKTAWLAQQTLAEDEWPEPESELEECILACCVAVFLHQDSEHCMRQLRTLLGPDRYPYLVLFLGYIRTCLNWAEAHPELSFEADQRVQKHLGPLIQDEPALRDFFANYQSRITMQADRRTQWLTQQYHTLLETEHKVRAESDEQASRMKSLLDSTFEGIWGLDLEGRITFVNAAAVKALGYQSADELIGKNAHDLVHSKYPDGTSYPKEDCPVLKALKNGTSVHLENEVLWREDGTSFFTLYRSNPIKQDGHIVGAVSTFVDNTERRNILEQLTNSQEWLSATLKSIGDAVIATSADDEPKIVFMNDVAEKLTGWTLEEVKGRPVAQAFVIMDSRTREQATSPMGRALAEGIKFELPDPMTLLSRTGEEFMIEHSVAPIRNSNGDVSGVALVFRDVTAKAQAEAREIRLHQDVRHAQEMLAGFFAQSPVPMVIFLGPEHEFSLANPPYVEFIGRNPLGRKIRDVFSEDEGGEYFALLDDVYRTGIPYIGSELPYRRPDKNGVLHDTFIQILYQPFREPDGTVKGILALVIDQTEQVIARKRIEDSEGKLKTLAEELLTTQSNLQSALESCRMGSWYVDLSQNYVSYSTAAQTILGIESLVTDPNEFVARYVHPDDRDAGHEALRKTIAERCPYHYEFRLYQPSGAMLWIISRGKLLVGADGQPYALTGIIIDITEARLTEAKLRESELRYRTLFDSVDQGVCLFEMIFDDDKRPIDYRFLEINPTFEAQTGLAHAQGKRARELVPDLDNFWFETYGRVALTGESIRFEQPAPAMGRIFDVYAVRVGDAEEHRVALLFSDITERKKQEKNLKDSEARFRTITEVMPQIVWSALPDGTINYLNQKWSEFSGFPLHVSLEGGWIHSLHPDDHAKASQIWLQSLTSGDMYETEFRMKHHSGQYRWGLMRAVPIIADDGTIAEWMGTWTDIHDQKVAAEELAQAKHNAEVANAAKTSFLANMSHEIRTPLGAIIGFSELLRDPDLEFDEREEYLEIVIRNGQGLTRIIDDILDLAKVEAGKLDIEALEFSVPDLLNQILDLFKDKARAKNIYLLLNIEDLVPKTLVSDATRVRQILINLVGNAIKFTNQGGIRITVQSRLVESGRVRLDIAVKDTGIGLSTVQQAKLFEPFVQADSTTTRKFGGTGLGLSLSKRLAKALGGDITIPEGCEGRGCTFMLSFVGVVPAVQGQAFRVDRPMPTSAPGRVPNDYRLSGIQVLVAEDSIDNQVLTRQFLSRHGAIVEVASDGEEAIRKALTNQFDVVLMDIQMPHVDGLEATRALRSNGYKKPIIALTAHAMAEERGRTQAAGCDGHLTKPLSQTELLKTIEMYLR